MGKFLNKNNSTYHGHVNLLEEVENSRLQENISDKINSLFDVNLIVQVALEDIVRSKNLRYGIFLEIEENEIYIHEEFGKRLAESHKRKRFPIDDDLYWLLSKKRQFIRIPEEMNLPVLIPRFLDSIVPNALYLLPISARVGQRGYLLFANSIEDCYYLENQIQTLNRVAEIIQTRIDILSLIDTLSIEIRERKKTEEIIQHTLAERNTILEAAEAGISFIKNNTFFMLNRKMEEMFGYTKAELCGRPTLSLFPSRLEYRDTRREAYRALSEKDIYHAEKIFKRKDGSLFRSKITGRLLNSEKPWEGSIWIAEDVTLQHERQKALMEAKEKAENATRIKDKFVALVSHDLKGPLHRVMGYLQILEMTIEKNCQKEELGLLRSGISACNDMNNLINEILNMSRLKGGEIRPAMNFIQPREIAEKAIQDYEPMAKKKNLKITNEIPSSAQIIADPKLLLEVLNNLISNAIKFTAHENSIRIYTPDEEPSTIAIRDTGVGIEKEKIPLLFNYETKLSTIGTDGEKGTGFGLPLSHDIIVAHGGKIEVQTSPGAGSTFYIRLPAASPLKSGSNNSALPA